jgi:IclR family transcriptional regulator, KDG regulon repressor
MSRKPNSMRRNDQAQLSAEAPESQEGRYLVAPILKAMKVLELVCRASEPMSLNDIAKITGQPKTTVFRYLRTLESRRMVEHDAATDRYQAGIGLWWLSHATNPYETLRRICQPAMMQLRAKFNETVNLGVLSGNQVVYLAIVESRWTLRMRAETGALDPVHCTALGKALVAFRPRNQREAILPKVLVPVTKRTIVDRAVLLEQYEVIRTTGYAVDLGENEEGSCCLAAPICDDQGSAIAALSISGPVARVDGDMRQSICASLITACAEISRSLSGQPLLPKSS